MTSKAISYNLIVHSPNSPDKTLGMGTSVGEILIEPLHEAGLFKAKVFLHKDLPSYGYQLFINGESNYELMQFNISYFFVGRFENEGSLTVRLKIDRNQYIATSLQKKTNHTYTTKSLFGNRIEFIKLMAKSIKAHPVKKFQPLLPK